MTDAASVARAFTEAVNRKQHDGAAALLAEDVEVISPGGAQHGREAWLESRLQQPRDSDLSEEIAVDEITDDADGAELRGRLVQRWTATGETAHEMPVLVVFEVADGLISRLELRPG